MNKYFVESQNQIYLLDSEGLFDFVFSDYKIIGSIKLSKKGLNIMINKPLVFDNEGKTFDRYTLINTRGEIYSFSKDPFYPLGVGTFAGTIEPNKTENDFGHLGKKILDFSLLNKDCQKFVKDRL